MHDLIRINEGNDCSRYKVLFLGYATTETSLIDFLIKNQCEVWHTSKPIHDTSGYDLVVSFGYKHIIKPQVLLNSIAPIINLHISYLPWNRGAHPNFWSFFDNTPRGITIHLVDTGVDTGKILYQKHISFEESENTFTKTYKKLIVSIEDLFIANFKELIQREFITHPQKGNGSYHSKKDLPNEFLGWNSNINSEIIRIKKILTRKQIDE